jgi:hypothetical protein
MQGEQGKGPLDEPGKPLAGTVINRDGSESPVEIPQTKRDNCASAAAQAGGLGYVTDAHLANWDLTRDAYNEFRMDDAKARRQLEDHRRFYEVMLPEFTGPPDRDVYIETLKQLMPDDWQKHVPPDS